MWMPNACNKMPSWSSMSQTAHLIFQFQYASLRPVSFKAYYGPSPSIAIIKTPLAPTRFLSGP